MFRVFARKLAVINFIFNIMLASKLLSTKCSAFINKTSYARAPGNGNSLKLSALKDTEYTRTRSKIEILIVKQLLRGLIIFYYRLQRK